jgi:DNA-binding CsgD family transcriptional regulator
MPIERTRGGPAPGKSSADLQGAGRHAGSPTFAINGHHFIAIPHKEWLLTRSVNQPSGKLRAAGVVRIGGRRHVLLEREEFEIDVETATPMSSLLTSRELQIAYSVAEGKCDKVIAYELGISEYTVREHMRRIFHKLKVSKRAALVAQLITARFEQAPAAKTTNYRDVT